MLQFRNVDSSGKTPQLCSYENIACISVTESLTCIRGQRMINRATLKPANDDE